ncbi:aldehyde dehydrogenase family protein [Aeromicrobium yanjiei]|uniref:Aldehyde dehydrogenase family protein n=1 Tax=Aeromicrobium yanjiei TaxID=2662028 RepID=A0A5Q2MHR1_9ACTN|nr:aldehyde dehydrogenase family protein [Aeromicrobium yanjiei]QGG40592.1 aldehyde dehydrogenase family protein [Aeromicrobium yanjiei]
MQADHWIDGAFCAPSARTYLPTLDPMTTRPWAEIARGDATDVDAAVQAAHAAYPAWRDAGPSRRAEVLWLLGDLIAEHAGEMALMESRDAGKVIREVTGQHTSMRAWFHYYATLAMHNEGRSIPLDSPSVTAYTTRDPFGVVGVIPAFNSPVLLGAMSIAPALAAGNTVVVKTPEVNALSLLKVAELSREAGLPDGCFNIVHGYGAEAGDALVGHPLVRKIFFTGGPDSAKVVGRRAAEHLKPIVTELGGKSANIFFEDVNVPDVVNGVISGIFAAAGQTCVAGSRLLVHRSIADELVSRVAERAGRIVLGNPTDQATEMGPISQEKILRGVHEGVDRAIAQGAELVTGGLTGAVPDQGWFYAPTILGGVTPEMDAFSTEFFGPVLAVTAFDTEEEALALANGTEFGLAAGIWTRDLGRAHRVARNIVAGTAWINMYRAMNFSTPFGGTKTSGSGRVNGMDGFSEFTQTKSVWVNSDDAPVGDPFVLR